jgi:hypothetical protein
MKLYALRKNNPEALWNDLFTPGKYYPIHYKGTNTQVITNEANFWTLGKHLIEKGEDAFWEIVTESTGINTVTANHPEGWILERVAPHTHFNIGKKYVIQKHKKAFFVENQQGMVQHVVPYNCNDPITRLINNSFWKIVTNQPNPAITSNTENEKEEKTMARSGTAARPAACPVIHITRKTATPSGSLTVGRTYRAEYSNTRKRYEVTNDYGERFITSLNGRIDIKSSKKWKPSTETVYSNQLPLPGALTSLGSQQKELPTMSLTLPKIEAVTLVDGHRADQMSAAQLMNAISNENKAIENLSELDVTSTYITQQVAKHTASRAALVTLLDTKTKKEKAPAEEPAA